MNSGLYPQKTGVFRSPVLPLPTSSTAGIALTVTHGLGTPALEVFWVFVCLAPDNAYLPGDEAPTDLLLNVAGMSRWQNASQAGLNIPAGSRAYNQRFGGTTFAPTGPNWGVRCYAKIFGL